MYIINYGRRVKVRWPSRAATAIVVSEQRTRVPYPGPSTTRSNISIGVGTYPSPRWTPNLTVRTFGRGSEKRHWLRIRARPTFFTDTLLRVTYNYYVRCVARRNARLYDGRAIFSNNRRA